MNRLIHISECASTNDEILNFLDQSPLKNEDILALYTLRQKHGRGQYGNSWITKDDDNIAISFAINPKTFHYNNHAIINYYTAVILRDFIANLTDMPSYIKWPNDLIIKNKKVSGILLEHKNGYLIIGIGINVLQKEFKGIDSAGSLYTQTGIKYNPHEVAEQFFDYFVRKIACEIPKGELLKTLNKYLYKCLEVAVFEIGGVRQNGIIQYADENGRLWVELDGKTNVQSFYHKEIKLMF